MSIRPLFTALFAAVILMTAAGQVCAGWITIRNDTKQELAIQEVTLVNGKPKFGKAIKLLPGESIRELKSTAGSKSVVVAEVAKPNTVIAHATLEWKRDDVTFSIKCEMNVTSIAIAK